MTETATWSWVGLLALGGFHGLNPGMGWLFAVALGLQDRRRHTVWRAMAPLGAGHLLAVGATILVALLAGAVTPLHSLRWPLAAVLIGLGFYRLYRHHHPRGGAGMRVGMGRLAWWSFLVASSHGAGLMVLPLFLGLSATGEAASSHAGHSMPMDSQVTGLIATLVHSAGYLMATALAAWLVLEKFGLMVLRTAWINLDFIWVIALLASGALTLLL